MSNRLDGIIIPALELKDVTLADALKILRSESVKHDQSHVGIQITTDLKPAQVVTSKSSSPPGGWSIVNPLDSRLTILQRDISLTAALQQITGLANCRLVLTVDGVAIVPATMAVDPMLRHTIPLPAEIFGDSASPERYGVDKAAVAKLRTDPKKYFTDNGVTFSENASCSFNASRMVMIATNTADQIDLVHAVLEGLILRSSVSAEEPEKRK